MTEETRTLNVRQFDIIGDVHGKGAALRALLARLGYEERGGVYRHPEGRRALFIGDLVDRGDDVGDVLRLACAMEQAGTALVIMGNHEYNILAHLHDLAHGTQRCNMNDQKRNEMRPTLAALEDDPRLRDWLFTLPTWLERDGARFVHAYWGRSEFAILGRRQTLSECGWDDAGFDHGDERRALERILKGPEIPLPAGVIASDKHGFPRHEARVAWWLKPGPRPTLNDLFATRVDALDGQLASLDALHSYEPYGAHEPPVFFGHYGLKHDARIVTANAACVDFDGGHGAIGAYRYDGETRLDQQRLIVTA